MPEHERADAFETGLSGRADRNLSSNFGEEETPAELNAALQRALNALSTFPDPRLAAAEIGPDVVQQAQDFQAQGGVPQPTPPPSGSKPLISPAILSQMQSLIQSIDPSLNFPPETLAGFLSTVTDEDGRVKTGVFDSAAQQPLQNHQTGLETPHQQ